MYALWTEWASRSADLAHGLPAYFARVQRQAPGGLFYLEIAVWLAAIAVACLALREAERRWQPHSGDTPTPLATIVTVAGATIAAAVMVAIAVVWRIEKVDGRAPAAAAMNLLRGVGAADRLAAIDLTNRRWLTVPELRGPDGAAPDPGAAHGCVHRARIARCSCCRRCRRASIALRAERAGGSGWLMAGVGIGRDQFALVTEPAEAFDREVAVRFPVDVRALVVRGDEEARRAGAGAARAAGAVCGHATTRRRSGWRAARCTTAARSRSSWTSAAFPSRAASGWGVRATARSCCSLTTPRGSLTLQLRNAPVDNVVTVRSRAWSETLRLAPGEERRIDVPLDVAAGAALVTFDSSAGFRPAAADRSSRDTRFLGAWVRVE